MPMSEKMKKPVRTAEEWFQFERQAREKGFTAVCGVDEAGRGPLAGPVYAAAVILPPGLVIEGVNDSKKLSEKKREALFPVICEQGAWLLALDTPPRKKSIPIIFCRPPTWPCAGQWKRCRFRRITR